MEQIIEKIAKEFENYEISWGIGGSKLLSYYKIVKEVNDLDIIVAKESIEKALTSLSKLGSISKISTKNEYLTESFNCFRIDDFKIDVMSGFKIKHECGFFEFKFEKNKLNYLYLYKTKIPLTSLEQWYIAYLLMINKGEKVRRIEEYFIKTKRVNVNELRIFQNEQFSSKINKKLNKLIKKLEKVA